MLFNCKSVPEGIRPPDVTAFKRTLVSPPRATYGSITLVEITEEAASMPTIATGMEDVAEDVGLGVVALVVVSSVPAGEDAEGASCHCRQRTDTADGWGAATIPWDDPFSTIATE